MNEQTFSWPCCQLHSCVAANNFSKKMCSLRVAHLIHPIKILNSTAKRRPGTAATTPPTSKLFSDIAYGSVIRQIFSPNAHLFLFTLSLWAIKPVERHLPNVIFSSATSANWWASWGLQSDVLNGRRQEPLSGARQFPHVWEQSQRMSNGHSTSNNRG